MSSIAYISDERMIEFHRSNGHRSINFWRLSTKRFERFDVGSLLFFIDKRYIHPVTKEKGIIGYGRARSVRTMSIKRTWDEYQHMNGYKDYPSFHESIMNATKDGEAPKQIQSIELDHVVFFKGPVFLSEVDFVLPSRLESFLYLVDGGRDVAIDLLKKAETIGIDQWFAAINARVEMNLIYEDIHEQTIRNAISDIAVTWTQLQENLTYNIENASRIGPIAYHYTERLTKIYLPSSSIKNHFYELLGIITWLKKELEVYQLEFVIVSKTSMRDFEDQFKRLKLTPLYI